jgi:quinol monooxygenase YgiN
MITIERSIQKVRPGKWAELEEIDKRFNAVESRLGFPPKKRYRCMIGGHDWNTLIIERQWDSLAAFEATYEKYFADPELQALAEEVTSIVESARVEVYTPLP